MNERRGEPERTEQHGANAGKCPAPGKLSVQSRSRLRTASPRAELLLWVPGCSEGFREQRLQPRISTPPATPRARAAFKASTFWCEEVTCSPFPEEWETRVPLSPVLSRSWLGSVFVDHELTERTLSGVCLRCSLCS